MKLVEYTRFYTHDGELVSELIDDDSCHPWIGGDYEGHCGGCYTCLMMQVAHYGWDGVMSTGERWINE